MTSYSISGPTDTASTVARPQTVHRADIDGLRALAVMAVILGHATIRGFTGGFIGVDIFFVISGYLIYGDLVKRCGTGRLSILDFYARRVRRTLPALYVVGFVSLAVGFWLMMPGDFDAMARSLIETILLIPNLFLIETSYFDALAASRPLLHTWSLGVEEQFYLFVPLLPLAIRRYSLGGRRLVLFALFLASLVVTIALRHVSEAAAFYLMPARIFEFLIGAMLIEGVVPPLRRPWQAEILAVLAFGALGFSLVMFGDGVPHPGLVTLLPCFAAAAIIHAGAARRTLVGSLLGASPIAFIGLISYSLYLWHWPMLVLARYADVPETPLTLAIGAVALVGLSILSWRYVETPFRRPASLWRDRAPWLLPGAAGGLAVLCLVIVSLHGLPGRFSPEVASMAAYADNRDKNAFREGQCFITSKSRLGDFDRAACLEMDPARANVLLLGDSHAAHLWTALRDTWPEVNFLQATASGCKPLVGTTGSPRCTTMMNEMIEQFVPGHKLDGIVISARWDEGDAESLPATIAAVRPYVGTIAVFGPSPRYNRPVARLVARAMLRGDFAGIASHRLWFVPHVDAQMRTAAASIATYVSPYAILCPNDHCRLLAAPNVPIQSDFHHLTPLGADVLMAEVRTRQLALFARTERPEVARLPGPASVAPPGLSIVGAPDPGLGAEPARAASPGPSRDPRLAIEAYRSTSSR